MLPHNHPEPTSPTLTAQEEHIRDHPTTDNNVLFAPMENDDEMKLQDELEAFQLKQDLLKE